MAAKLRRTLDVRLATAWVFGPRFFCGHYVLADCTDETSAERYGDFFVTRCESCLRTSFRPTSRVAGCSCLAVRHEFNA